MGNQRITNDQRRILEILVRQSEKDEAKLTAREIGLKLRVRNFSDWAHAKLHRLHKMGLAAPIGVAFPNSRTWDITPEGLAAIAAKPTE